MKHASLKMLAGAAFALMLASTPALASDNSSGNQQKAPPQYPNATRQEPKLDLTDKKEQEALSKGLDAVQANNKDQATQLLQPLIDSSKSKYVQALALQGLARVHATNNDLPGGIDLLKRSLDNGVMPNDTYFTLELELAQFYLINQQYQQSVDTVEKWRSEGKSDKPESHALEVCDGVAGAVPEIYAKRFPKAEVAISGYNETLKGLSQKVGDVPAPKKQGKPEDEKPPIIAPSGFIPPTFAKPPAWNPNPNPPA